MGCGENAVHTKLQVWELIIIEVIVCRQHFLVCLLMAMINLFDDFLSVLEQIIFHAVSIYMGKADIFPPALVDF